MGDFYESDLDNFFKYLNIVGAIVVVLNKDRTVRLISRRASQILEQNDEEIIGKNWLENFISQDCRDEANDFYEKIFQQSTSDPGGCILSIVNKNGDYRSILWNGNAFKSNDNNIVAILCAGEDITEKVQSEKKSYESVAQIQAVMNAATQIAIIATDPNGLLTTFNEGAERMLGYKADEMVGKQTPAIIHLSSEVEARGTELTDEVGHTVQGFDVFVEYAKQGRFEERDWTYVRKDGSHLRVNLVVTAVKDTAGKITGFLGVAKDVSETRKYEENLKKSEAIAKENESKFKSIYKGSYDAIMLFDNGKFFDCNPKTLTMFGYDSVEEFTKLHPSQVSPPKQPDSQDSSVMSETHIKIALVTGTDRFEWVHRRKDGTDFPAEVLLSAFEYQGKKVLQATVRDITERKMLHDELIRAKENVEKEVQERTNELQITQRQLVNALSVAQEETVKIKTIVQSIGDGVFVLDHERKIVLINHICQVSLF